MRLTRGRGAPFHLSYEMNAHPAESRRDFAAALETYVEPIRARLAPNHAFGLCPHIGRRLVHALASARARAQLKSRLAERNLYIFSINAFPLAPFHARRVKERVYAPSWADRERADLTCAIADVLADVLPTGVAGSVSTLGGSYRFWRDDVAERHRMAQHYLQVVAHLARLERERGITIVLAAEPEPDTTFEDAADVVQFRDDYLLPALRAGLERPLKVARAEAEALLARFFCVNLDVCHQSVLFRDPVAEWRALTRSGLRVAKLHLTSALALRRPGRAPAALRELMRFDEPRYLHQFAGTSATRASDALDRGRDLGELNSARARALEEVRVHFHVPLSAARVGRLQTTRADTARALNYALSLREPPHLVIETYTWPLLARNGGAQALVHGITREYRWVLAAARARGFEPSD
ncbi:MAG: metabolite traffic protein EboE [Planctomycetota bacterium]